MSWVTGVLLIVGLGEYIDDESGDFLYAEPEELPAIIEINQWLIEREQEKLTFLSESIHSGKRIPAEIFGAAFNHLPQSEFKEFVRTRSWKEPENVQLLVKDQEDDRFTLTNLNESI